MSDATAIARVEDYKPPLNGHATKLLRLVQFEEMRPRLADGYLMKHLLGSAAMAVVYGESGSGKTFFALHLSLSVAAGMECFGRRVRRVGVCYVAAEAGPGIENRVAAYKREVEFPETMPFVALETSIDLCKDAADLHKLVAAIRCQDDLGFPIGLIVVDTLSRTMGGGNENQPDDMGAFVRNIDALRAATGAAVLIVHHSGKNLALGARGHSLLRAATDTEIEITRDDATKLITARVTKQRELATDGTIVFTLRQVELGIDQDGDPVTSCVVEESDEQPSGKAVRPLSKAQGRALQLLAEVIDKAGEIPLASNHIPPNTKCVAETLWREYCYRGGISNGGQRGKEQAFKRAADELLDRNRIGKWEPLVWHIS